MKKKNLFAIAAIVLISVIGDAGADDTRKAGPPPNDLRLSATPYVASSNKCTITAWVHNGSATNYPGYTIVFTDPAGTTRTTNGSGKVNVLIPMLATPQNITATAQFQSGPVLTSNVFVCQALNPNQ